MAAQEGATISDIFSLGVMIYNIKTYGKYPYSAERHEDLESGR